MDGLVLEFRQGHLIVQKSTSAQERLNIDWFGWDLGTMYQKNASICPKEYLCPGDASKHAGV